MQKPPLISYIIVCEIKGSESIKSETGTQHSFIFLVLNTTLDLHF